MIVHGLAIMGALTTPKTQISVKQRRQSTILLRAVIPEPPVQASPMTPLGRQPQGLLPPMIVHGLAIMGALTTPKTQIFVQQRRQSTILLRAVIPERYVPPRPIPLQWQQQGLQQWVNVLLAMGAMTTSQNANLCETTEAGYYSPAGSNTRTACTGKPDDSSWTSTTTGLSSDAECSTLNWACNAGFDNQEDNAQCEATIARHYSPAGSNGRIACSDKPDDSSWTTTTGLTSEADCATQSWQCDAGYDNQANSDQCEATIARHYSPAGSNARITCSDTDKPDHSSWDTATTGLAFHRECWTCNANHYKSRNANACIEGRVAIATGGEHTCAILNDDGNTSNGGPVKCWGSNDKDQTEGGNPDLGGKTATHIAAGYKHTCAILNDQSVKCWGANENGQIGGGTSADHHVISGTVGDPLEGQSAMAITGGEHHTCAILDDDGNTSNGGPVKCWGYNEYGQTGGGTSSESTISGTAGDPLKGQSATHIAAGSYHTCAILVDKTVTCWGLNRYGQAGGGTSDPKQIISGTAGDPLEGQSATAIAGGAYHTCAILNNQSVKCWGYNGNKQTGRGTPNLGGKTATHIATGAYHTCAILNDKSVKCWGSNANNQTEGGTPNLGNKTATHIALGDEHTCAILSNQSMRCWGNNEKGQAGGGTPNLGGKPALQIATYTSHTCVILDDDGNTANGGPVKCWGNNSDGETGGGTPDLEGKTATHIAVGWSHTCAILNDDGNTANGGPVKCWGDDSSGEIEGGTPNLGGKTATHIAAGGSHTCVILNDRSVKCWGNNDYEQTGEEEGEGIPDLGGKPALAIAAGWSHTCAILEDRSVKCWGNNGEGQIGGGIPNSERIISGTEGAPDLGQGKTAIALTAGEVHTCAILNDRSVKCWGLNRYGRAGGGTPDLGGKPAIAIAGGGYHTCAILDDDGNTNNGGPVKCWGDNDYGQTEGGTPNLGWQTATALVAGFDYACVILVDRSVRCWGGNDYGQIGGGTPD